MTLTEFLLARIAEDEADAQRCIERRATVEITADGPDPEPAFRIYMLAPNRVLADCKAKRRTIRTIEGGRHARAHHKRYRDAYIDWAEYVLRLMATVYDDHPDYREEWRP